MLTAGALGQALADCGCRTETEGLLDVSHIFVGRCVNADIFLIRIDANYCYGSHCRWPPPRLTLLLQPLLHPLPCLCLAILVPLKQLQLMPLLPSLIDLTQEHFDHLGKHSQTQEAHCGKEASRVYV